MTSKFLEKKLWVKPNDLHGYSPDCRTSGCIDVVAWLDYVQVHDSAAVLPSKQLLDQSTATPREKLRRFFRKLTGLNDASYFYDDGFPREDLAGDAAEFLRMLEAGELDKPADEMPKQSSNDQLLARVLVALEDLSFKCFGGIGLVAPPMKTYNRTFLVLDETRKALGVKVAREYRPDVETSAIERIQQARLTWAMICPCSCQACDDLHNFIRDIDDSPPPEKTEGQQRIELEREVFNIVHRGGLYEKASEKCPKCGVTVQHWMGCETCGHELK